METFPPPHLPYKYTRPMKRLITLITLVSLSFTATSQESEFTIHDNGLIYDIHTMNSLGRIVDSLNLKFKTCDPKAYRSLPQGQATYFHIKSKLNIKHARELIRKNASPEDFKNAFPLAHHRKDWIVKSKYTDYRGTNRIEYATLPLRNTPRVEIDIFDNGANDKTTGWIFTSHDDGLSAMYLHDLQEIPIPTNYASLIQYVDCMIDTTAEIYRVEHADLEKPIPVGSKIQAFLEWADRYEGEPQLPDISWDSPFAEEQYYKFRREYEQWNNKRLADLDVKMNNGHYYKSLLMEAAEEAIAENTSNEVLEFYVERYLSPSQALEMKRSRRPMGYCSMDIRPRLHAASICRLAAETSQWDIFLRAHLDIMNDRFDRQTDGSYAWAGRGTYLKELEELDINAPDLLIGTCLRSINVNDNHYCGDIRRIGRALSETSTPELVVAQLATMISDETLDTYNRLLMAYVFDNFIYHLPDGDLKTDCQHKFDTAIETLPFNIARTFEGD